MRIHLATTLGAGLMFLTAACGGGEQRAADAPATAGASASGPTGTATITGAIRFTGAAPANPVIDMQEEPQCRRAYAGAPTQQVVTVNPNRTLADVFVYVKSGLPEGARYAAPATPMVIDQRACRYVPRVLGVMVGQPLEIRNSDSLLHNVKAVAQANRPFNISQPAAGLTTQRTFSAPEVMVPLECSVHGWMHAFVGVVAHPFFATTGTDGMFTIGSLPAGTYTIEVWHERFGTQTATVTVGDGESKTQDFTYAAGGTP